MIQQNYFYKVGMTFNNSCHISNSGLNPIKRGRPSENIEFKKNSSLFDHDYVNPNWREEEIQKWAKYEAA